MMPLLAPNGVARGMRGPAPTGLVSRDIHAIPRSLPEGNLAAAIPQLARLWPRCAVVTTGRMSQTQSEPRRASFQSVLEEEEPVAVGLFARAKDTVLNLPDTLRTNIQERPVATLGAFTALGIGVGVVFGNRVLRSVLITALGQTAIELGRDYVRRSSSSGRVRGVGDA